MLDEILRNISHPDHQRWIVALAGALVTGLLFYFGLVRLGRRVMLPQPPSKRGGPPPDHFLPTGNGKRKAFRRTGNEVQVLVADEERKTELCTAWVMDRSTGGLCLALPQPMEISSVLSVRAAHAPDSAPWVHIKVKWCHSLEGRWELGGQFVQALPWGTLLLFG
jgi:hypothetical protein